MPHPPNTTTPTAVSPIDITFQPGLWSQWKMTHLYDLLVVHGTYPVLWGCRWEYPARLYQHALRPGMTVVDIGPASGFFLDKTAPGDLTLHLVDRYIGSLAAAALRLVRFHPHRHQHDALNSAPLPIEPGSVDVVVLGMVLHCMRGETIAEKEVVFDHIQDLLKPDGQGEFIGYTVLAHGVTHSLLGRVGLRYLNARGVFSNTGDSLTDLVRVLSDRFEVVELAVRGSVVMWRVRTR